MANKMTNDHIITCRFATENALYMAYMPFLQGGGLFIQTHQHYPLGMVLKLAISLVSEPEIYTIEAQVVWITPVGAQGNKPAGIGVAFQGEESRYFSNKIETYLAGMLKSTQITDTM
jgi:type IV pilus assembly protein PilZ